MSTLSFKPDITIYLHDSFENCFERLQERDGTQYSDHERRMMRRVHEYYPQLLGEYEDVHRFDLQEYDRYEDLHNDVGESISQFSQ